MRRKKLNFGIIFFILFFCNCGYGSQIPFEAVKNNDVSAVKEAIRKGANIDEMYTAESTYGEDSWAPLAVAAYYNSLDVAKLLLEKGANIEIENSFIPISSPYDIRWSISPFYAVTPLMLAAINNSLEVARLLIQKGADLNKKDHWGMSALMRAAGKGDGSLETARLLIKKGADVNLKSNEWMTALMATAYSNSLKIAKLLIENGVNDLNARYNEKGNYHDDWTAVMLAAENNSLGVVTLLIEKGADINAKGSKGKTALRIAGMKGHNEMVALLLGKDGVENLVIIPIEFIEKDLVSEVQKAIDEGADVNIRYKGDWTPLMKASENNSLKVAKLLIRKGADINAKLDSSLSYKFVNSWPTNITMLMVSAAKNSLQVADLLIKNGVDIDERDSSGCNQNHQDDRG